MPRALPMPPDERRAAIIAATEPLLVAHGRQVSTRQLAEAAGVAEGTLFRVFANKDELIDATVTSLLDVQPTVEQIAAIDRGWPLERRLSEAVAVLQARLARISALFGSIGPGAAKQERHSRPEFVRRRREENSLLIDALVDLMGEDAAQLRVDDREAAMLLTSLAFSGRHNPIAEAREHSRPEQIVDLLLHGILRTPDQPHPGQPDADEFDRQDFTDTLATREPALAGKDR